MRTGSHDETPANNAALRSRGTLEILLVLYVTASLIHFVHNAEFISSYPNLPAWVTRSSVYATWLVITLGGVLGYLAHQLWDRTVGLLILCVYAAIGLDGLLHYTRAPLAAHTHGMNLTIGFEALSAGLLLLYLAWTLRRHLSQAPRD